MTASTLLALRTEQECREFAVKVPVSDDLTHFGTTDTGLDTQFTVPAKLTNSGRSCAMFYIDGVHVVVTPKCTSNTERSMSTILNTGVEPSACEASRS
mgnify:CR=1 FL=1